MQDENCLLNNLLPTLNKIQSFNLIKFRQNMEFIKGGNLISEKIKNWQNLLNLVDKDNLKPVQLVKHQ
jgi:hypothetical protein